MKDELKKIIIQQYCDGKCIYELALAYSVNPSAIKKVLRASDRIAHERHPFQEYWDIFDEIKYANYLLKSGNGRIVTVDSKKYVTTV